jgi:hypothetical protein
MILVLLIIPFVALGMDRLLYWVQRELFPHRFGGMGILNRALRTVLHGWEDLKGALFGRSRRFADQAANDLTKIKSV